jgi:hypothetical protein
MTQEAFIKELEERGISYETQGEKILVTGRGSVSLSTLETIPPGVEFQNGGSVYLNSLETIPPGVEFQNTGDVVLTTLETIPLGVRLRNGGYVYLPSILGGWMDRWKGNIEGVDSKRLLNHLIRIRIFI